MGYSVHNSKIMKSYYSGKNATGEIIYGICMNSSRVDRTHKKPRRKIPETCTLRVEDICRVRITDRGMHTRTTSRNAFIAAMESRKFSIIEHIRAVWMFQTF